MKTVPGTSPDSKPAQARTRDMLIETVRQLVDHDGAFVEPGSIDSGGFNLIAGVFRYRLEITDDPELMDWDEHIRLREEHAPSDDYTQGRDFEWMGNCDTDAEF